MAGTNGQLTRSNQSAAGNQFFGRKFGLAPSAGIFAPGSPFPVSVTRISKVSSVGITQLFSTTWNITAPVGVAAGHLLISVMVHNTASAVTLPSGWTLLFNVDYGGPRRVTIAYKIATASEPAPARDSYTFTLGAAGDGAHIIAAYRGVNQTTPIDVSANTPTSTSVNITIPEITTTVNSAMLLWVASDNNGNTLGAPAGTKVVSEMFNSVAFSRIWLAEEFDATLGATGTRLATTGGASVNWAAASIALAPVVGSVSATMVADKAITVITGRDAIVSTGVAVAADKALVVANARDTVISTGATVVANKAIIASVGRDAALSTGATVAADKALFVAIGRNATISTSATIAADKALFVANARDTVITTGATMVADKTIAVLTGRDATISAGATVSADKTLVVISAKNATVSTGVGITADKAAVVIVARNATVSTGATVTTDKSITVGIARDAVIGAGATVTTDKSITVGLARDAAVSAGASLLADKAVVITVARDTAISTAVSLTTDKAISVSIARDATISTVATTTIAADKALAIAVSRDASISVGVTIAADKAISVISGRDASVGAGTTVAADKSITVANARNTSISAGATLAADKSIVVVVGRNADIATPGAAIFQSVHASITQRGVGTLIAARVATPAIIQRVPSVGVVRAGAQGRITQTDIRTAITQEP